MRTIFSLVMGSLLTASVAGTTQSAPPTIVHVASKQSGDELLRYPDATILVLADGSRATVGQLRTLADARRLERESMLTIDAPASVTIHFPDGDASRSRYASALAAATAYAAHAPLDACVEGHAGIRLVNGKSRAVAFTPGAPYRIDGCGFGSGGSVAIAASAGAGSLALTPTKWTDTEIDATVPATITGVSDRANVTLTVLPNDGTLLQQPEHSFVALRADILVKKLETSYWISSTGPYEPAVFGLSGAGVANGSVQFARTFVTGHCDLDAPPADVFSVGAMPLAPGFGVDTVLVTDTTSQLTIDDGDAREVVSSPFAVSAAGDGAVNIHYQMNSAYRKPPSAIAKRLRSLVQSPLAFLAALPIGKSACSGSYEIAVTVTGPSGMPPLTR